MGVSKIEIKELSYLHPHLCPEISMESRVTSWNGTDELDERARPPRKAVVISMRGVVCKVVSRMNIARQHAPGPKSSTYVNLPRCVRARSS